MTTIDGYADRLARAVRAVAADAGPAHTAEHMLDRMLAALPGAEAGALVLMHPQTGLFWTGAVTALLAESCHPFFGVELAGGDDCFRRMAATRSPARALRLRASNPELLSTVVEKYGFSDELRAVLPDGAVAWGGVSLWRRTGAFTADDEQLLDAVAGQAGAVLRRTVLADLRGGSPGGTVARGMLVVADGQLVEFSLDDPALRAELESERFEKYRQVDHLVALAAADPRFSTVLRSADGRWLSAHGMELDEGRTAVILTSATPADLLGPRVVGAGLSTREIEVVRLLCRGLSDAEIADELVVSPHTVHDHVRAIRGKLGVRTRAAVVARVFDDTYFDAFISHAAIRHTR
ncbi:response regulator transcription factor [Kribbella sp. GL6]|uniref:response regulator transcription factor n=1 Tax=Kribbella sp. GL6 TaxID=3419765 RepID=UPI003CFDCB6E